MTTDKLICADMRDVLPTLEPGSVQLIITSPPYNAGKEYESRKTVNEYLKWQRTWMFMLSSLLSPKGSLWLNLGYMKIGKNSTLPLTYIYYPLTGLELVQEIVWHYEGGMAYKKRFAHRTERWMWFARDSDNCTFNLDAVRDLTLNRTVDKRNNVLGKNPTDYWFFDRVVSGTGKVAEKTNHPCQFPEAMIRRIVRACSNPGDVVLDPMMGSGTVPKVARDEGRHYIGIDQNQSYVDEATNRLASQLIST